MSLCSNQDKGHQGLTDTKRKENYISVSELFTVHLPYAKCNADRTPYRLKLLINQHLICNYILL